MNYASTLPPPACIARAVLPSSSIRSGFGGRRAPRARRQYVSDVVSGVGIIVRRGVRRGLARSYSNGSSTSNASWVRHVTLHGDWIGGDPGPETGGSPSRTERVGDRAGQSSCR